MEQRQRLRAIAGLTAGADKASINAVPGTEFGWQVAPWAAGACDPQYGFDKQPVIGRGAARIAYLARQGLNPLELIITQPHTDQMEMPWALSMLLIINRLWSKPSPRRQNPNPAKTLNPASLQGKCGFAGEELQADDSPVDRRSADLRYGPPRDPDQGR